MTYLLIAAILLDECFAEVKRFHPLVGFGHYALFLERHLYTKEAKNAFWQGVLCWCLAILPILLISILGMKLLADYGPSWLYYLLSVIILYFTIGQKSLKQHGQAVMQPLLAALNNKNNADKSKDIKEARYALSMIVSRDTQDASPHQIANATIETMTENTHDAVIGPMLFFIAFGAPGAILFRLVNTLDAMWGYRTTRYEYFGKFSARADDVLGFVPARVTAILMAVSVPSRFINTLKSIWLTGRSWYSPNAGLVMAAGAGALNIKLGGNAVYQGQEKSRLTLGIGKEAKVEDIQHSIRLIYKTSLLLIGLVALMEFSL